MIRVEVALATLLLVPIWLTTGVVAWSTFIALGLRFELEEEAATVTQG
ncbi:MAG: hypothetical protein KJO65_05195 [Gemmatimonadetes bacterium]|nr:hypothetical protein [Gemmatimonadota bacterium]